MLPAATCEGGVGVSPARRDYFLLSDRDQVPDREKNAARGGEILLQLQGPGRLHKTAMLGVRPRRPDQNAKFPPFAAAGPLKGRPSVGHWGSIIPAVRLGKALRSARGRERDSGPSPQSPFLGAGPRPSRGGADRQQVGRIPPSLRNLWPSGSIFPGPGGSGNTGVVRQGRRGRKGSDSQNRRVEKPWEFYPGATSSAALGAS